MRAVDLDLLLPADLPPGEQVLWHGRPAWLALARGAFRADLVALWFALMAVWTAASVAGRVGTLDAIVAGGRTLALGFLALALIGLLAWLSSRTTLYVVTTRRVVMKIGIALPVFLNLPFAAITSASLRLDRDGTGDIPLALAAGQRIAYLHLWPHARPFRINRPEPTLRAIPGASAVAETLSRALIALANDPRERAAGQVRIVSRRAAEGTSHAGETVAAA